MAPAPAQYRSGSLLIVPPSTPPSAATGNPPCLPMRPQRAGPSGRASGWLGVANDGDRKARATPALRARRNSATQWAELVTGRPARAHRAPAAAQVQSHPQRRRQAPVPGDHQHQAPAAAQPRERPPQLRPPRIAIMPKHHAAQLRRQPRHRWQRVGQPPRVGKQPQHRRPPRHAPPGLDRARPARRAFDPCPLPSFPPPTAMSPGRCARCYDRVADAALRAGTPARACHPRRRFENASRRSRRSRARGRSVALRREPGAGGGREIPATAGRASRHAPAPDRRRCKPTRHARPCASET